MSRSSERRRGAVGLAGLLALAGVLLFATPIATADPGTDAPVLAVEAPVVDIEFSTSDLQRAVRVDESTSRVRVTLDATVLFGKDRSTIRPGAARRLNDVAKALRSRGPGEVRIVGYTDDLGSAAHGLDLSRRRARAVAGALRRDLPASSYPFTVVGKGEADPVVPNTSEASRRINRRVVVTYHAH